MLERKIYTPRSSFSSPQRPAGLLTLPVEVRLIIYGYSLADTHPRRLLVKRYPGHPWLYRQPKSPVHVPGVLTLNKQIYIEARDVLYKRWLGTPEQSILIGFERFPNPHGPKDWNDYCTYRSVRELAPVLRALPRIRLEVEVSSTYRDQVLTMALLRWIRAVLNARPLVGTALHEPLQSVDVILSIPQLNAQAHGSSYNSQSQESACRESLAQIATAIRTVGGRTEVWYSSYSSCRRYPGETTKGMGAQSVEAEMVLGAADISEERAWKELQEAWKRMKADEKGRGDLGLLSAIGAVGSIMSGFSGRLMGR